MMDALAIVLWVGGVLVAAAIPPATLALLIACYALARAFKDKHSRSTGK
jgi:hypothetical protein